VAAVESRVKDFLGSGAGIADADGTVSGCAKDVPDTRLTSDVHFPSVEVRSTTVDKQFNRSMRNTSVENDVFSTTRLPLPTT